MKNDVPDARAVFPGVVLCRFAAVMTARQEAKASMKMLEENVRQYDASITEMMAEYNTPKLVHDGIPVTLSQSSRSTLSKKLLLEHNVAASVIAACTKVTTFTVLRIGKEKE